MIHLSNKRILGDDRNPKQIFPEETLNSILEVGQVDAIAAYKHEAISRGLPYIALPSQINLGNPDFSNFYKKASYTFSNNGGKVAKGSPYTSQLQYQMQTKISMVQFLL